MQATIGTLSRIVSRSFVSGVVERVDTISNKSSSNAGGTSTGADADCSSQHHELTTAVSGFPKSKNGQYSIENILKGQIGDDAYFISRHVDDWNNNSNIEAKDCADKLLNPSNISGRVCLIWINFYVDTKYEIRETILKSDKILEKLRNVFFPEFYPVS